MLVRLGTRPVLTKHDFASKAEVEVDEFNAYGIDIVNQTVDLCSYFEGVICPLPQVNFTGRLNLLVVVYPKLVQVTVPTPFPNPTPPRSRASPTAFPTSRLMLAWSLSEMAPGT